MEDAIIWRYIDFTKYVDLISTSELFFCRADRLGDPFEGSYPEPYHTRRIEEIRKDAKDFDREITGYVFAGLKFREYVFVNCWHASEHESAALWRLYPSNNEGIAVQSSQRRLAESVAGESRGVWIVPVQYIDYFHDDPPVPTRMAPFRYKRKSFEHEKELRAIVYADTADTDGTRLLPPSQMGLRVSTDLGILIETVCVAPTAPEWLVGLTARISAHFGIAAPVVQSSLAGDESLFI